MNIALPKRFFYSSDYRNHAYVEDGILYIEGNVNYEDLMYSIAYSLRGYNFCIYCKRRLTQKSRSLDHMYPRNWGGISIPENLVPSCSKCNSEKTNMTYHQYNKWRKLDKDARMLYYERVLRRNERMMKMSFILPKEWVTEYDVSEVLKEIEFDQVEQGGNAGIDQYYAENGHYPRPIIVSSNGWIFKGMHILYHAKQNDIKRVPAVILDNVIRLKN